MGEGTGSFPFPRLLFTEMPREPSDKSLTHLQPRLTNGRMGPLRLLASSVYLVKPALGALHEPLFGPFLQVMFSEVPRAGGLRRRARRNYSSPTGV
jgi:hypothetical protein